MLFHVSADKTLSTFESSGGKAMNQASKQIGVGSFIDAWIDPRSVDSFPPAIERVHFPAHPAEIRQADIASRNAKLGMKFNLICFFVLLLLLCLACIGI
jgi:hypothetical protein